MLRAKNILILLFLSTCKVLSGQCPDFTDLTSPEVTCYSGEFSNPFQHTGINPGRHVVITQQGSDFRTGHQLPFLPEGENAVVRLGNDSPWGNAEAISYRFVVNPDSAILLLKFAVVLEDPGHPAYAQPRFVMRILDTAGQLVDPCAEYDVTAGSIPGFLTYTSGSYKVRWRPWTNVGIDLSDYAGQIVQLQFLTYDCDWWGHFGYAYFTASCVSNKLKLNGCNGDQVTLEAPSDFESYVWDNGEIGAVTTYIVNGTTFANCVITSATGCSFTLCGTISSDLEIPTISITRYDTICEGDVYDDYYFNLPPQMEPGTHMFRNTFYNSNNCTGGDVTITLFLTVIQQYTHYYDVVCQGTDYNAHGFQYSNLLPGSISDTLVSLSPHGCELVSILHLTITPSSILNNSLAGDSVVCQGDVCTYFLESTEDLTSFNWTIPAGVNLLYGQGTPTVYLRFTNDAPNPAIISATGANGCNSGTASMVVRHRPSYHLFIQDTLCLGNDYHRNGFDLARQDSVGLFTFINQSTTSQGCDSISVLQLFVTETPIVNTLAQPSEICNGQSTLLHAVGDNAGFSIDPIANAVSVGDILCTDASIEKPEDWPVAGKVALGIVFYVDSTGEHGWAVNVQQNGYPQWSTQNIDIPSLVNYNSSRDALMDFDGYSNTQKIRFSGNASVFPAAYVVDFDNGWYLPAAGQLSMIYSHLPTVNSSLQIVNGTKFPKDLSGTPWWAHFWFYLSSSESDSGVWVLKGDGGLYSINKQTSENNVVYYQTIGNTTYTYYHTYRPYICSVRNF